LDLLADRARSDRAVDQLGSFIFALPPWVIVVSVLL
jgi:hypothetical protein